MRISLSVFALLALLAVPAVASAEGPSTGDPMPESVLDTKMKNVDGKEITLADQKGEKGTLVVFTCNHCPYVKAWEERITEVGNMAVENGIGVVAINPNDPAVQPEDSYEKMQERAEKLGLKFPYVVDSTSGVAKAFDATKTPHLYLFDKDGKLVYEGAPDNNSEDASKATKHYLKDAVTAVIDGKEVPVAETKALGCGIKWRDS